MDSGAHSPTNAAILRSRPLDLVVVVSPMSEPVGPPTDIFAAPRWGAARVARREVEALHRKGIAAVVFRPGIEEQEVMGCDFMSRDRVDEIVQQAFLGAGAHAANREARRSLAALMPRPPRADCEGASDVRRLAARDVVWFEGTHRRYRRSRASGDLSA